MGKLSLGVVGCGVIGQKHIEAAAGLPQVKLLALADVREQVVREVAARFGIETVYTDAQGLLTDVRIGAVVLAVPATGRAELARQALQQGKHVLLEKPAAINYAELEMLKRHQGDRIIACASSRFRLYESARVASDVIESGALGPLRLIRCRAIKAAGEAPKAPSPAWRLSRAQNGGGILVNWGVYDLDYLLGLTGWTLKPTQVLAQAWPVPPVLTSHVAEGSDAETHVTAFIRCMGGEVITLERGEYMPTQSDEAWQIVGERGSLRFRMVPDRPRELIYDKADAQKGVISETIWQGEEPYGVIHAGPVSDFVPAILEDRPPATGLSEMLTIQKMIDAIYASAEQGVAVTIS